ncbi:uncharacterized protein LOC116108879 [Pistacia vera]|uniref:uncharacterized protein LOC116108879 n=1 Tax=Pistacia vera TaxID=55513 RepID=UPI001262F8BB|nr:uncharacterized protein LOC116108879 [Pistacia vera]
MKGALGRRDWQKYYRYHRDIRHNTNECRALKDVIEDLIQRGHIKKFVKEAPAHKNTGEQNNQVQQAPTNANHEVLVGMIYEGPEIAKSSRRVHEQYACEAKTYSVPQVMSCEYKPSKRPRQEREVVGFTFEECEESLCHNHDAIVIAARIDNTRMLRVMVDNGSATNIIFLGAFREIRFIERDMRACPSPLYRFTGDSLVPKGMIDLHMTLRA